MWDQDLVQRKPSAMPRVAQPRRQSWSTESDSNSPLGACDLRKVGQVASVGFGFLMGNKALLQTAVMSKTCAQWSSSNTTWSGWL